MDPALAEQIRAYELALGRTEARPAVHAHQRAALVDQLALARASADGHDYLVRMHAAGTATAVAIAPWLDRHAGVARLRAALGDPGRAAAHDAAVAEVAAARGDAAVTHLLAAELALTTADADADLAAGAIATLLMSAIDWRSEADAVQRAEHARLLDATLGRIAAWMPGLTWAAALERAPIRHRVPFDRARWALIGGWIASAVGRPPDAPPAPPGPAAPPPAPAAGWRPPPPEPRPADAPADASPPPPPPPAAALAAAYRAQLAAAGPEMTRTRDVLARILALADAAPSGPALMARLAEADLAVELARAPHLDRAAAAIARADERAQAHLAHHHRARAAAVAAATTATEVELALAHADACAAVEASWFGALAHAALHAAGVASHLEREPTPARRAAAVAAATTTAELCGARFDEVVAAPWLAPIFARVTFRLGQTVVLSPEDAIAAAGEVGYTCLTAVRAAAAMAVARAVARLPPGEDAAARMDAALRTPRLASPEALRAHLAGLLARAGAAPAPDPARRVVHLWDHPIDLADLHTVDVTALRPRP